MLDDTLQQKLEQLSLKIIDVSYAVTSVIETENPLPPLIIGVNRQVEQIKADYAGIVALVPSEEQENVERLYGRRVMDLRRHAANLPKLRHGEAIPLAESSPFGGLGRTSPLELSDPVFAPDTAPVYQPGENGSFSPSAPEKIVKSSDASTYRVSGEVEAWCGPCGGLRDHTIVALVGGEPKQVLCQSCGGRHGFRTSPARSRSGADKDANSAKGREKRTREQLEARRKEKERLALQKELATAEDVRPFAKRARYAVGQIIDHPSFGRGKIENVLKGSLLVRFRSGLKSVSTL